MKNPSLAAVLAAVLAATLAPGAHAQGAAHDSHAAAQGKPAAPAEMSEGEVRKIDKAQGKVTLKHGPIVNLDMPAMTMVFRVADPKLLDGVKVGDKVRFAAQKQGGAIAVVAMSPVR